MADGTSIEWTDATWNPITGCSVHSAGCTNCYAMKLAGTRLRHHPSRAGLTVDSKAGPVWTGKVRFNDEWLMQPLRWTRPRRIFVVAHGDLFHEAVPDEWIDRVFAVMALCPHHQFQVLTKRADRMRAYFAETWQPAPARRLDLGGSDVIEIPAETRPGDRWDQINLAIDEITLAAGELFDRDRFWTKDGNLIGRPAWPRQPLPNVWLGVSVEDQRTADERIPDLLATPAALRWISAEPLLGFIDLTGVQGEDVLSPECWGDCACDSFAGYDPGCRRHGGDGQLTRKLDWVVAGGESGAGARPMDPEWVRLLRDLCAEAGVPFLFKQWGVFAPLLTAPAGTMFRGTKKITGRLLDGVEHNGFPA
ncbi:phage Gp37/Gp68 family protein [Sphingomonas sp. SRS2]|uniref:phage Gp37/Gp68 family protein n=1 Tax=Sphingomonas sp. SRS2 TaxID=133190 RepID=UPI00061840A2|nr:phage Gp37/Gp68 family protein [Sphingomonas sp. SRS2]KKC24881.1 hypothetical protein WP12_16775 [Sphingomonas sp. SRS2]